MSVIKEEVFTTAVDLMEKEVTAYRTAFDQTLAMRNKQTYAEQEAGERAFDTRMATGLREFQTLYADQVQDLQTYVEEKKTEYQAGIAEDAVTKFHRRDAVRREVMQGMLAQIYAIRLHLDPADDFLQAAVLEEESDIHKEYLKLQLLLQGDDVVQHGVVLGTVYTQLTGKPPPSIVFDDIYPTMVYLLHQVTQWSVGRRSLSLSTDPSFADVFANPPSAPEWSQYQQLFEMYPLNARFAAGQLGPVPDAKTLESHALIHLMNRNRATMPYVPATSEQNRKYVPKDYASYKLDPVLSNMTTYCSLEGLSLLFTRSGFGMLLQTDVADEGNLVFDASEVIPTMRDVNYGLGGMQVRFSSRDMTVSSITIDKEVLPLDGVIDVKVYRRIIATAGVLMTFSIHLGIHHLVVGDEWNYLFSVHVPETETTPHPLHNLVRYMALGVREITNAASTVLLNGLKTNVASTISDLEPSVVLGLTQRYRHTVSEVSDWSVIRTRIVGTVETPLSKSLDAWWTVICNFVEAYVAHYPSLTTDEQVQAWLSSIGMVDVGVVRTVSMMYFNQVVHELASNNQWVDDALSGKVYLSTRSDKEDGIPSLWVHQRTIETLISTTGNTIRFFDRSLADYLPDVITQDDKKVFDDFYQSLQELETLFRSDPTVYLSILCPSNVECSIAW